MKRFLTISTFLLLFLLTGCSKNGTCTCVDVFGGEQTVELAPLQECSDLEPMMGSCTED